MAMRASRAGFVRLDGIRFGVTVACAVAGLLGAAGMTAWSWRVSVHAGLAVDGPFYGFGAGCILLGFVTAARLSKPRLGGLMMLLGAAYYLQYLRSSANPVLFGVGVSLAYVWAAVVAHLVLALPDGRVRGPRDRVLLAGCYLMAVTTQTLRLVLDDARGPWPDYTAIPRTPTTRAGSVGVIVFAVLVILVTLRRMLSSGDRRWRFPVWCALLLVALASVAAGVACLAPRPSGLDQELMVAALEVGVLLLPLVLVSQLPIENLLRQRLRDVEESRQRVAAAAMEERRLLQRDLHDGAQHAFFAVHALLGLARDLLDDAAATPTTTAARPAATASVSAGALPEATVQARDLVRRAHQQLLAAINDLRGLVQGMYPSALTSEGLRAAVDELADTSPVPVEVDIPETRWYSELEITAYFLIAEAIANACRHARANQISVRVSESALQMRIEISDDGTGGARLDDDKRPGLADRASVIGGSLSLNSPLGTGTVITALLPTENPSS